MIVLWKLRDQNDFLLAEGTYSAIILGPLNIGIILFLSKGEFSQYRRIYRKGIQKKKSSTIVLQSFIWTEMQGVTRRIVENKS